MIDWLKNLFECKAHKVEELKVPSNKKRKYKKKVYLSDFAKSQLIKKKKQGYTSAELAKEYNVHVTTVYSIVKKGK